ncbi:MAG TPA: hypothetical protein VH210_12865 [Gaiellaceae bacterium]|jgi:hypothetical protein|nr:hypothetical protein [Gaiellaceae bacterium]
MLRLVVAVLMLVSIGAILASSGRSSAPAPIQHTCGLTDRQFLENYRVQMAQVGMYGDDYLAGSAKPQDVIAAAREAARVVRTSAPFDPSLMIVRHYAPAMFLEYGRAVKARAAGKNAGPAMYRAYSISTQVNEVLNAAAPGLSAVGCDVADLL